MHLSSLHDRDASGSSIRLNELELSRLLQMEGSLEAALVSAQTAFQEAINASGAMHRKADSLLDDSTSGTRGDRVQQAEMLVRKLEKEVESARRERELAQGRLETAHDRARRLDESATVALVVCELVDALKTFERAAQRLATALEGSSGKGKHDAAVVAASLRISGTRFASEARVVISGVESYRAALINDSVNLKDSGLCDASPIEGAPGPSRHFVGTETALSIVPQPLPPVRPTADPVLVRLAAFVGEPVRSDFPPHSTGVQETTLEID